jgi:hypothetical protein
MATPDQIAHKIGLRMVEIITRPEIIPFYRGDLRKSIAYRVNPTTVEVGSNLVYARAVHDGRPPLVLKPKPGKKILAWWKDKNLARQMRPFPTGPAFSAAVKKGLIGVAREVHLPAMQAQPYLSRACEVFRQEGFDFLRDDLNDLALQVINGNLSDYKFKKK